MSGKSSSSTTQSYVHFLTGHEDLVHDVAYDYYGRRMATVSSDQRLKIFDLSDDGDWVLSEAFKAHDASINRVIWGPPEHGQILATCSHDRTVKIWEEQELGVPEPRGSGRRWKRQYHSVAESRTSICDIAFPPTSASTSSTSTGLKLAFISTDGAVHIYECREPQDLTHWIAVDLFHTLPTPPPRESEVSFCLDFCPSRWGGEQLVVGAMDKVQIYRQNSIGKFQAREELPGHKGLVRDVSWAVSMGRSYHLIATASKDGHVRIFRLTAPFGSMFAPRPKTGQGNGVDHHNGGAGLSQGLGASDMKSNTEDQVEDEGEGWKVELEADFPDHRTEVWKVAWNATGTILSSTGDDGKIRLWKQNLRGEFVLMSVINTPRGREDNMVEDD